VEKRLGRPLTESEKRFAIRQAQLCAELLTFLEEINNRLPERTPEELDFLKAIWR